MITENNNNTKQIVNYHTYHEICFLVEYSNSKRLS